MKSEVQFLLCDMFLSNRPDIPAKQWDVPAASVFWHFTSRFPRRQCQGIYLQDSPADQQWHHPNSVWHPEGPNKVRIHVSTTCTLIAIWAIYLFFWYLIFWKKKWNELINIQIHAFIFSLLVHTLSSQPKLCWRDNNRSLWSKSHPMMWSTISMT